MREPGPRARLAVGLAALVVGAIGIGVVALDPGTTTSVEEERRDSIDGPGPATSSVTAKGSDLELSEVLLDDVCERHAVAVRTDRAEDWRAAFRALDDVYNDAVAGREVDQRLSDDVGELIYNEMEERCSPAYLDILDWRFPPESLDEPSGTLT